MIIFHSLGAKPNYLVQLDSTIPACHINYNQSPQFNGHDGKTVALESRKKDLSTVEHLDLINEEIPDFDDVGKNYKLQDRISLWKLYWLEYINAFDKMTLSSPKSVVTVYIGRHAIELGLKYLHLVKTKNKIDKNHNLGDLIDQLYEDYQINEEYMKYVPEFCKNFGEKIEGGNVEYFRFPEYSAQKYFEGNRLDLSWLNYNIALILLKLIHFAGLDEEFADN